MTPDAKYEKKVVRSLAKFLADEGALLGRWRAVGNACVWTGSVLWVLAIFVFAPEAGGAWILAALAALGGLCLGIGLWFSTFATQWPIVRPFVDAEKVRQRSVQLGDRG